MAEAEGDAPFTLTKDDRLVLVGGLRRLRREHRSVEDCWYSCPKSEDGCCNEAEGDGCNCGADMHNALVDELIRLLEFDPHPVVDSSGPVPTPEHQLCDPAVVCPCASEMGNRLLRQLLDALGWHVPARSDPPRVVWDEALARVRAFGGGD